MSCWSDLNNDILEQITSFLSLPDHHRFSAVCQSWRWVAKHKHSPLAKQLPWLVMRQDPSTRKRKFFSLAEKREYCIDIPQLYEGQLCGSSFGWLFVVDPKILRILLLNPFTREHYQLPKFPDMYQTTRRIFKFILSDDPSTTLDFTAVLLNSDGVVTSIWRHGEAAWTWISCAHGAVQDAVFFRGSLYASCGFNSIGSIELGEKPRPRVKLVGPASEYPFFTARGGRYLVVFLGELLLVQRFGRQVGGEHTITCSFAVHKIDLDEKKYCRCTDLGDYAIFLGASSPVVVDSRQFPGCKRNSIYFTDLLNKTPSNKYDNDDIGVYDMKENTVEPCHLPEMLISHPYSEPPIWLTPNCSKI